jgi:hypothetical protein
VVFEEDAVAYPAKTKTQLRRDLLLSGPAGEGNKKGQKEGFV